MQIFSQNRMEITWKFKDILPALMNSEEFICNWPPTTSFVSGESRKWHRTRSWIHLCEGHSGKKPDFSRIKIDKHVLVRRLYRNHKFTNITYSLELRHSHIWAIMKTCGCGHWVFEIWSFLKYCLNCHLKCLENSQEIRNIVLKSSSSPKPSTNSGQNIGCIRV